MHETELELLARQLAEGLRGDHDVLCRELVRLLGRGYPVTPERLASALQMTAKQVAEALAALADLEVDPSGNVVGWGLTFIPTPHRFLVQGQQLYTWCALDALIYPALLQVVASVESLPGQRHSRDAISHAYRHSRSDPSRECRFPDDPGTGQRL